MTLDWIGTGVCIALLVLTAYGAGKWTARRKNEGRR